MISISKINILNFKKLSPIFTSISQIPIVSSISLKNINIYILCNPKYIMISNVLVILFLILYLNYLLVLLDIFLVSSGVNYVLANSKSC